MRQAGRANLLVIATIVMAAFIASALLLGRDSMSSTCGKFLGALAKGDVETLTNLSYLGDKPKDDIKKQWEFTLKEAAPHYRFMYRIENAKEQGPDSGAVSIKFWRNALMGSTYDEPYDIPMVRRDGKWLVDVKGLSRDMFPALPR